MGMLVDLCEITLIVILPPIGVFVAGLQKGINGARLCLDVCLNVLLTLLFYIPGIVHGVMVYVTYVFEERDKINSQLKIERQKQTTQAYTRGSNIITNSPDDVRVHVEPGS